MYEEVLERLMPIQAPVLQSGDVEWVLQIRVAERSEPELWSRITKRYLERGSPYSAEVRQAWPLSVERQLDRLGTVSSSSGAVDVAGKITLRERHVERCAAVDTLLPRLEGLTVPVLLDDSLALDAPTYELSGTFRSGSVAIHLRGAGGGQRV